MAISGDTAVVGASREDAGGDGAGAVNVFQEPGPTPTPTPTPTSTPDPSVGGVAELPEMVGMPLETADSSGPSAVLLAGVVGASAIGATALTGAAWYARRRRTR